MNREQAPEPQDATHNHPSDPERAPNRSDTGDAATPEHTDLRASRRHFLHAVAGGALAWIAAACGRRSPTPSPIATPSATNTATQVARSSLLPTATGTPQYHTYLPFIEKDNERLAAAAQPTDTPTPVDTPTPTRPPPTPTPTVTPFPPGPPSKLGLHVERNLPAIFDLLNTGAITAVTTLELDANFARQIKQSASQPQLIGRIHVDQVQLGDMADPIGTARAFVDMLLPYADDDRRRPHFDAWISYNEPVVTSVDEMQRLADFESERVRLLGDRGIRSIIGNFPTGGPDLPLWEHFLPAVQTAQEYNGWLGLHEYSAPTIYYLSTREDQGRYPGISPQDEGWLTLRYRKVYNQFLKPARLAIPLVFTEFGVDGLVDAGRHGPQGRGWRDFQRYWAENGYGLWGPGAYVEQLVWFDKAMQQDDYVLGGCIYALGTSSQWLSYDIDGPVAAVLEQYLRVHAPA